VSQSWRYSGCLTLADLGAQGDVLLGSADSSFLRGHFVGICWGGGSRDRWSRPRKEEVGSQTLRRAGGGPAELKVRSGAESPPRLVLAFALRSKALSSALRRGDFLVASEHCRFFPSAHHSKARRLLFFPICFSHTHHHIAFRSRTPQRPQVFSCAKRVC